MAGATLNLSNSIVNTTQGIVKADGGTLVFSAPQYYTGSSPILNGTAINGGTLRLAGGTNTINVTLTGSNPTVMPLIANGGTLDLNGNSQAFSGLYNSNALPNTGGTITNSSGTAANLFTVGGTTTSLTFGGTITGNLSFYMQGVNGTAANLALTSAGNSYSGTTNIEGGTLSLRDAASLTGTSGININFGTLSLNNQGLFDITAATPLGGVSNRIPNVAVTLNAGQLQFLGGQGLDTQTAGAVTVNQGVSAINVQQYNGNVQTGAPSLTIASLTQTANSGAMLNFTVGAGTLGAFGSPNVFITSNPTLTNGIIGGWAVVNGADFAGYTASQGVGALGTTGFPAYSGNALTAGGTTDNISVGATVTSVTSRTINSLRFSGAFNATLNDASQVLNLGTGGLLTNGSAVTIAGGQLTAGGSATGPASLFAYVNGSTTTINSQIVNNGANVVSLARAGAGTLTLTPESIIPVASYALAATTVTTTSANGTTGLFVGELVTGTGLANVAITGLTANTITLASGTTVLGTAPLNLTIAPPTASSVENGTTTLTTAETTFTPTIGMAVGGTGILGGTTITNVAGSSGAWTLTLSQAAIASATNTLTFGALSNTYTGTTYSDGGVATTGALSISGLPGSIVIPGNLNLYNTNTATVTQGAIAATSNVSINSGGTLTLSGTNVLASVTFNGIGTTGGIGSLNGATLLILTSANAITSNNDNYGVTPSITGTALVLSNAAPVITTGGLSPESLLISAPITSAGGAVTVSGTGGLILAGASTFTNGVNLTGGSLIIGASSSGTPPAITSGPVGTGTLSIGGGTTILSSNNFTLGNAVSVGGSFTFGGTQATDNLTLSGTVTLNAANPTMTVSGAPVTATISGVLASGTGTTGFTKAGAGTLVLSNAANTYSGATAISGGILKNGAANAIPSSSALSVSAGAEYDLNGFGQISPTFSGGGVVTDNGSAAATFVVAGTSAADTTSNINGEFDGIMTNGTNALSLTKAGLGTYILTGNNNYSGTTTINAGILQIGNNTPTGSVGTGPVTIAASSSLVFNVSASTTAPGAISGLGSVAQQGTGTVLMSGNNSYSGGTTVASGAKLAVLNSVTSLGSGGVTINGGQLLLQGQQGLTTQLYAENALTNTANADPNFNSLSILLSHLNTLSPQASVNSTIGSKINFDYSNSNYTGPNAMFNTAGATTALYGFTQTQQIEAIWSGYINVTAAQAGIATFASTSDDGSMIFVDGTTVVNNNLYQGATTKTGTINLTPGLHQITLAFYQGGGGEGALFQWNPNGIGLHTLQSNEVLVGTQSYGNAVTVTANSGIDVSGSLSATIGSLSINGSTLSVTSADTTSNPYNLAIGAVTLTGSPTFNVANNSGATPGLGTLGLGAISGSSNGITKTGIGVLALNALNSFSGGTTISAGTVVTGDVGALGSGLVNLAGGTLNLNAPAASSNSAFTLNGGATNAGGVLKLTDGAGNEARSAFTTSKVAITNNGFRASFIYTPSTFNTGTQGQIADGVTFTIQNTANTSVGGNGGGMGYTGINNSAALSLNIFPGASGGVGTNFVTGGANPGGVANASALPVLLASGDPIQVNLSYNGTANTLTEVLTDTLNGQTVTQTLTGVNYQTAVGATSAFVGFTGGTGGAQSTQQISNFTYTPTDGTQAYTNGLNVSANSTVNVTGQLTATMGTLAVGANTLSLTSTDTTTAPYSLTLTTSTFSGSPTFNVQNSTGGGSGSLILSGNISDTTVGGAVLTKTGPGLLVLGGLNNGYLGNTAISGGTLSLANAGTNNNIAGSPAIILASATTLNVSGLGTGGSAGTFNLGSGATAQSLQGPNSGTGTVTGNVTVFGTGSGGGTIVGTTGGLLSISGTLAFQDGSTASFTLPASPNPTTPLISVGALTATGTVTVNISPTSLVAGTYDLIGYGNGPVNASPAANFVLGEQPTGGFSWTLVTTVATNGQLDLTVVAPALSWTGQNGSAGNGAWDINTTANWAINGTGGQKYTDGNGVIFYDTYYGPSVVSGTNPTGNPAVTNSNVVVASGGVQPNSVTFASHTVSYTLSDADGNSGLGIGGATGVTLSGTATVGAGSTVTLTNPNSYTGATTVNNASTLIFSNDDQLGNGQGSANIVLGADGNGGTLRATGGSSISLMGGNGLLGSTRGILLGPAPGNGFSGNGTIDVTTSTTLTVPGVIANNSGGIGNLIVASTGGGGKLVLTGANTYNGTTTINSGAKLQIGDGSVSINSLPGGAVTDNGALVFNINSPSTPITISNAISGSTGSLEQIGGGTIVLSPAGSNTYAGATLVTNGTIQLMGNAALPTGTPLTLGSNTGNTGILDLNGSNATVSSMTALGGTPSAQANQTIYGNAQAANFSYATLTFAGSGSPSTFSGSLQDQASGPGSPGLNLTVSSGTLNLTGNTNTYGNDGNGFTTVSGTGTLQVNNSLSSASATGSSTVTVNSGGTLSGSGFIIPGSSGSVSINGGGTIIGGTVSAPLTISGANGILNLAAASISQFTPTATGFTNPLISVTTLSESGSNALVRITNGPSLGTGTYDLIGFTSGPSPSSPANNFAFVMGQTFAGGDIGQLVLTGNQLDLVITGSTSDTTASLIASPATKTIHMGGPGTSSALITLTLTNTGTGTADTINYSGQNLSITGGPGGGLLGAPTSGLPLNDGGTPLPNASSAPNNTVSGSATFTSTTVGQFTVSPTLGTLTDHTSGHTITPTTGNSIVNVNYYAQPALSLDKGTAGSGSPSGAVVLGVLYLNVTPGSGSSAGVTLTNTTLDPTYQDNLGGSFSSSTTTGVSTSFNPITPIPSTPGSNSQATVATVSYTAGAASAPGSYGSFTLTPTSINTSSTTTLSGVPLTVQLVSTQQRGLEAYTGGSGAGQPPFGAGSSYVATWSVQSNSGATGGSANSYGGLLSGASGTDGVNSASVPGGGYGPFLHSTTQTASGNVGGGAPLYAQILAGYNSGTYTGNNTAAVSMSWRSRFADESSPLEPGGAPSSPPLPYVGSYLVSNVLNLSGLGTSNAANQSAAYSSSANTAYFGNSSVTEHETDPFALQMNYDANLLSDEKGQAKKGTIYVGWLAPAGAPATSSSLLQSLTKPEWLNAVTGDFDSSGHQTGVAANGRDAVANFNNLLGGGSFADFVAFLDSTNPNGDFSSNPTVGTLTAAQLSDILGSWGVDPTHHAAWAVINPTSHFAVVPEPSTLALAALGLLGLAGFGVRRRRERRRNAVLA